MRRKIICFYLPQFYEFKENNEWWGKGFTEWSNVKKASPLFPGHYQPTIPLNDNFYCLADKKTMEWQIKLAKFYKIYGFCFYHYWFGNGKLLMEKPIEMFLKNPDLNMPFCFSWANHNWSRTWTGGDTDILMEVRYDEKDLRGHFEYLVPFFKDERYIRVDGKPIFIIYMPELIPYLHKMKRLFNLWCREEGLGGIVFVSQAPNAAINRKKYSGDIDYSILYEPNYTQQSVTNKLKNSKIIEAIIESPSNSFSVCWNALKKRFNKMFFNSQNDILNLTTFSYSGTWRAILRRKVNCTEYWIGGFSGFDNSPRKKYNSIIYKNSTPQKFEKYFSNLLEKYNSNFVFLMAWNEWGEGAYLEPDKKYKYTYLEAIKRSVENEEMHTV